MVAEKKFRSDPYYRLSVDVPPLQDRRDDIPLLVRYFANKYARRSSTRCRGWGSAAPMKRAKSLSFDKLRIFRQAGHAFTVDSDLVKVIGSVLGGKQALGGS
jgi:hypothetical protein